MAKIVFYCNDNLENIQSMEYYRQDIEALRALGHEVAVCNRYRDIPWRFVLAFSGIGALLSALSSLNELPVA